jgi:hypothetical protein
MAIGAIEIQLLADVARLRTDMESAKGVVSGASKDMQSAANMVKGAFAAVGVSLSVAGLASFIKLGIDAADAANEMSLKTGVASKDIAGLTLAFKSAGVPAEAMGKALAAIATKSQDSDSALAKMNITSSDTKDNLYKLADSFKASNDYQDKLNVATDTFGKKLAIDMIPVLEMGSEGLADMQEAAKALGLEVDQNTGRAADDFNDTIELIGMSATGLATQVAASLLPTLGSLAAGFLETMKEGDALQNTAEVLSSALKGVFTAGLLVVEAFSTVGKTLGAAGAQVVAVLNGDFKLAMNIGKEHASDIKKDWGTTAAAIGKVWDENSGKTVTAMGKLVGASKLVRTETDSEKESHKKAAAEIDNRKKETEKLTKAGGDLVVKLKDQLAEQQLLEANGGPLSERQREHVKLTNDLRDAKIKLTPEQEKEARALIDQTDQLKQQNAERETSKKRMSEMHDELAALYTKQWDEARALEESNKELQTQNDKLGMSNDELQAYELNLIDSQIAQLALTLAQDQGNVALQAQIDALTERKRLLQEGAIKQEAIDTAVEWNKTAEQIGQSLTDSLFNAFESGKSFFKTLWDGIVNTFKTTALRLVINAVMNPVNAMIGTALGGGSSLASAASLTGGGGGFDLLSSGASLLGGIGGSLGAFGTAAGYGASALFGGTGLTALSGGASMIGAGSVASGAGMMAGVLAPIAAGLGAVYALYNTFKHERTPHTGGAALSTTGATSWDAAIGRGEIRFDGSSASNDAMVTMTRGIADSLTMLAKVTRTSNDRVTVGAAYADDSSDDKAWGAFRVLMGNRELVNWGRRTEFADGEEGTKAYAAAVASSVRDAIDMMGLPEWANRIVDAFGDAPTIEQVGQMVAGIVEYQNKLDALDADFRDYGGWFLKLSNTSTSARDAIIDLVGGIDALQAASASFVQNYYTQEEQAAVTARDVSSGLSAAGIDITTLGSKSDYRALLESLDPENDARKIAALLTYASSFATIGDFLNTSGQSLRELASIAPAVSFLASVDAAALADSAAAAPGAGGDVASAPGTLSAPASSMDVTDMTDGITKAIEALQTKLEAALASIASSTAGTQRVLSGWSDGDAVATRAAT